MKKLKFLIRDYFGFTGKESNGFIVLMFLVLAVLFAPMAYEKLIPDAYGEADISQNDIPNIHSPAPASLSKTPVKEASLKKETLFYFDPNTADLHQLQKLGMYEHLAGRIIRYREKGGRFRKKEDLKKIYGFPENLYLRLENFIVIPDKDLRKQEPSKEEKRSVKKNKAFDINKADSAQLCALKGIGPKRAIRIISFRDKLGGFISKDQLKEVYALDSAVLEELYHYVFVEENFIPEKININTASANEIARHPYISPKQSYIIVNYREHHGPFQNADHLKKIRGIQEDDLNKTIPYLTFE